MNNFEIILLTICLIIFIAVFNIAIKLIFMRKQICPKCKGVLESVNKEDPLEPMIIKPVRFWLMDRHHPLRWKVDFYYWCPKCGNKKVKKK